VLLAVLEIRKRAALRKHLMDVPPSSISIIKVRVRRSRAGFGLLLASNKGVPVVGLILGLLVSVYTFITRKTDFGRHIYSVGGNSLAAGPSGVNTKRIDVMVNMGLLSGVAGMVFTAYVNTTNPKDGVSFELDAIAAVFIGGTAVAGGNRHGLRLDGRWLGDGCAQPRPSQPDCRLELHPDHQRHGSALGRRL